MLSLAECKVGFTSCKQILWLKMESVGPEWVFRISANISSTPILQSGDYIAEVEEYGQTISNSYRNLCVIRDTDLAVVACPYLQVVDNIRISDNKIF